MGPYPWKGAQDNTPPPCINPTAMNPKGLPLGGLAPSLLCLHKGWFQLPNQLEKKNLHSPPSSCNNHFPTSSSTVKISHASGFVHHNMKGEGNCPQHFLPSIFEMSTPLRPTVKFSKWKGLYPPNQENLKSLKKNLAEKKVVFLPELNRFKSPSASATSQTPVVMISVNQNQAITGHFYSSPGLGQNSHTYTATHSASVLPDRHLVRAWTEQTALCPQAITAAKIPTSPLILFCTKS